MEPHERIVLEISYSNSNFWYGWVIDPHTTSTFNYIHKPIFNGVLNKLQPEQGHGLQIIFHINPWNIITYLLSNWKIYFRNAKNAKVTWSAIMRIFDEMLILNPTEDLDPKSIEIN